MIGGDDHVSARSAGRAASLVTTRQPALAGAEPQAGAARRRRNSSRLATTCAPRRSTHRSQFLGDVVVVALEAAARDAVGVGEPCSSSSDSSLTRWHQRIGRGATSRASSIRIATPPRLAHWSRDVGRARALGGVAASPRRRHRGAIDWFDTVLGAVPGSPGGYYHDVRHVGWVVRHIASIAADHPLTTSTPWWPPAFFHDAVYDPTQHDNEAESAATGRTRVGRHRMDGSRSCRHVRRPGDGDCDPRPGSGVDRDTAVLLAADLAVLAAEPARYADYATAVRREYAHVDDGSVAGRSCCRAAQAARAPPPLRALSSASTSGSAGRAPTSPRSWLRSPSERSVRRLSDGELSGGG